MPLLCPSRMRHDYRIYGLSGQPPRGEIEFLFVEPESVRSGRGQRLAQHFWHWPEAWDSWRWMFRLIHLPRASMWRWVPCGSPKFRPMQFQLA